MNTTTITLDEMIDHLSVLIRQEKTIYRCSDYLQPDSQSRHGDDDTRSFASESLGSSSAGAIRSNQSAMNETWRVKISEWTYNVIDYFNYDRELVFICMNYLDRFVMKRPRIDTKTYQLAAVTSLFIVVKTFQSRSSGELTVSSLVKLSQSTFHKESILAMEQEMLAVLKWHLCPPTPFTFAKYLFKFLSFENIYTAHHSQRSRLEIRELTRFFTELSVCDYFFVTYNQSTIAMASLLTAIDIVFVEDQRELPPQVRRNLQERIFYHTGLNPSSREVQECQHRLREAYVRGGFSKTIPTNDDDPNLKQQQQQQSQEATTEQQHHHQHHHTVVPQEVNIPSPICVSAVSDEEEDDLL